MDTASSQVDASQMESPAVSSPSDSNPLPAQDQQSKSSAVQAISPETDLTPDLQSFSKAQRKLFTEGKWIDHEFIMLNDHVRKIDDKTVDISNGGIIKTILRPNFSSSYPLPFSRIRCHVIGKVKDSDHIFMNTYTENQPLLFTLGQKETTRALEIGIQTMKAGEIALFDCKYDFCYGDFGNADLDIPERAQILYEVQLLEYLPGPTKVTDGVLKRYEKRGYGWDTPLNGTVCHIIISGRLHDEIDGDLFLEPTEEPILALIDDIYLPEGLEEALFTMKRGEISVFEVSAAHLLGDGFEKRRHVKPFPTNLSPDQDIKVYYRIELVDMDPIKETWVMTAQERLQEATRLKEIGNSFFRINQYNRAYKRYNLILDMFEYENLTQLKQEDKDAIRGLQTSSLNNMQVVKMKEKDYPEVITLANKTITLDTFHIRSYYRKAQSLLYNNDSTQALETLDIAMGLYKHLSEDILTPQIRKDMDKLLAITKAKHQKDMKNQRKAWANAFNTLAHTDERKNSLEKPPKEINLTPEESRELSRKLIGPAAPHTGDDVVADDDESQMVSQANELLSKHIVKPVSEIQLPEHLVKVEEEILAESLRDAQARIASESRQEIASRHNEVD